MSDLAVERGKELWNGGYYCAESVLLAFAESRGIQSELLPRIATGFCSGVSGTGGMCGAVSGAIMGIGLAAGRNSPGETVEDSYVLVRRLIDSFEKQFGSINCQQLTGCDLATEEGQRAYRDNQVGQRCELFVEGAISMAMRLVGECA